MYAGMAVAGAAAVVASASTLAALARAAGWVAWTPWLLPAALDVAGAAAGWCWLRPGAPDRARRFGRVVALLGAAGTLAGNAAGHLVASGYLRPGPVLVVAVGAVPAGVLVALAHLTALLAAGEQATDHAVPLAVDPGTATEVAPAVPAPRAVKGPRKLPTNSAPDAVLEAAARDVAQGLRKAGVRVTRRSLADGLRASGHGVGTTRAGQLLAALDDQEAAA
jgi:hypothetical protein